MFSSSHALSLSAALYLNFCVYPRMCVGCTGDDATNILTVSPRSPTFALFFSWLCFSWGAVGTDVHPAGASAPPSRDDPVHFNHNGWACPSFREKRGEGSSIFHSRVSDKLSTGNCKKLLTKLGNRPCASWLMTVPHVNDARLSRFYTNFIG